MKLSTSIIAIALTHAACITAAPGCRARKHSASIAPAAPSKPADIVYPSASALTSAPAPAKSYPASPVNSSPAKAPAQSYAAPAPAVSSAAASSGSSSSGGSPTSGGKPMIDSINDYRQKANLPLLTWDSTLAANSYKTCKDAGGTQLVHELNPGSYGQVLVFGFDDADKCTKDTKQWTPFEIFLYSWLCERADDPALGGICQQIWDIGHIADGGQTGHHDILASANYKKIGCAFYRNPDAKQCDSFPGVWGCDVA